VQRQRQLVHYCSPYCYKMDAFHLKIFSSLIAKYQKDKYILIPCLLANYAFS
jgi:hypothetical protein